MFATFLTEEMIKSGEALIHKLDNSGARPDAAFWFYFRDIQAWKLVIAELKVGKQGPKESYRQIQKLFGKYSNEIIGLSLDDVAVSKPNAQIVNVLRMAMRTGSGISGIRFTNNVVNGVLIEDAYVYRL